MKLLLTNSLVLNLQTPSLIGIFVYKLWKWVYQIIPVKSE